MKKLLPVLALAGIMAVGCEEYSAPEISNSGPTLTLTTVNNGDDFADTIQVSGVTTDDKYINRLGVYLYNKDEENSLEYGYSFTTRDTLNGVPRSPRSGLAKPVYNYDLIFRVGTAKIVNGNYDLVVISSDVHGLKAEQKRTVTVSGNASNTTTAAYPKVGIWSSGFKNGTHYLAIRNLKVYGSSDLRKAERASAVHLVFAKTGTDVQMLSPEVARSSSVAGDSITSALTASIGVVSDTTAAEYEKLTTSTSLRSLFTSASSTTSSVTLNTSTTGESFIVKTSDNLYVFVKIRGWSADKKQAHVELKYKRFYP
ncbi:MAG: hypothetical protein HUU10_08810 [Bacteroidetes bacterium]|nr:hypothetical protein [Bacteroidota bacterium]